MTADLPIEVVARILGYLNPADRREASMVSRAWHEASTAPGLHTEKTCSLQAILQEHGITAQQDVRLTLDKLDQYLVDGKQNFISRCQDMGAMLTEIVYNGSDLNHDLLTGLLQHCPNLKTLDLNGANNLFMSGQFLSKSSDVENLKNTLSNVKHLDLGNNRFLSNSAFTKITSTCRNLETLSLSGCNLMFHSSSYIPGKPDRNNTAVFTFEVVSEFMKQTPSLTSIDLSNTSITNDALYNLVSSKVTIQEIHLSSCKELTDKGIVGLCNSQRGIEVLDIGQNPILSDDTLIAITENLKMLKSLDMNGCEELTGDSVCRLSNLQNLVSLNLARCAKVTSEGFLKGLCTPAAENLTRLNLSGCMLIADGFVIQLATSAVNLVHLDMSYTRITDYSLYVISAKMKDLQTLNLAYCRELTDYGILGIERPMEDMKRPPVLQHDDGECNCSRKYVLSSVFTKPMKNQELYQCPTYIPLCHLGLTHLVQLNNIHGLRELDLSGCLQLSDNGIALVMKFPELRVLRLDQCQKLTDKALFAISDRLPSLEELSLARCNKITDDGVAFLVKNLKRLVTLNIQACDKVTNHAVDAICNHGYRIKRLNVSSCKNITSTALERLEDSRSQLIHVV